jgi:hypothetical protein
MPIAIIWRLESSCFIALDRSKTSSFVVPCMNGIVQQILATASNQTGKPTVTGTRNNVQHVLLVEHGNIMLPALHSSDLTKNSVQTIDQTGPMLTCLAEKFQGVRAAKIN